MTAAARAELVEQGVVSEDGTLDDDEPDALATDEPSLAAWYGAAVCGRAAFGPRQGQRAVKVGCLGEAPRSGVKGYLCAQMHGFNLQAAATVRRGDRLGLERLCRYLARPRLAHDRLEFLDEERLSIRLDSARLRNAMRRKRRFYCGTVDQSPGTADELWRAWFLARLRHEQLPS